MYPDSDQEDVPSETNVDDHQSFRDTVVWYILDQKTGDRRLVPLTCPTCLREIRDVDLFQHSPIYQQIIQDPKCELTKAYIDYHLCPFCSRAKLVVGRRSGACAPISCLRLDPSRPESSNQE